MSTIAQTKHTIYLSDFNLDNVKMHYIRTELDGYYTGDDLDKRVIETFNNFKKSNVNPLHFQFIEETRYNQETFRTESFLGWSKKYNIDGASNGSVLIKD